MEIKTPKVRDTDMMSVITYLLSKNELATYSEERKQQVEDRAIELERELIAMVKEAEEHQSKTLNQTMDIRMELDDYGDL